MAESDDQQWPGLPAPPTPGASALAPGTYDGKLDQAPMLASDYGLCCSRCGAACCVACCAKLTRAKDVKIYVCPRCCRPAADRLFYS